MDTGTPERSPKGAIQGGQVSAEPARPPEPRMANAAEGQAPSAARHAFRAELHTLSSSLEPSVNAKAPAPERQPAGADRPTGSASRLQEALRDRYVIRPAMISLGRPPFGQTEYRFRGAPSRVAFTENTTRLSTQTDQPSVARSMVDVAQMREWRVLRVTGSDAFKRQVWLEASGRGLKVHGHEPSPSDLQELRRQQTALQPLHRQAGHQQADNPLETRSAGRKTVLTAIDVVLRANGVPGEKRKEIMAAASRQLEERIGQGRPPEVRLYDPSAPPHRGRAPVQDAPHQRDRPPLVR